MKYFFLLEKNFCIFFPLNEKQHKVKIHQTDSQLPVSIERIWENFIFRNFLFLLLIEIIVILFSKIPKFQLNFIFWADDVIYKY